MLAALKRPPTTTIIELRYVTILSLDILPPFGSPARSHS
jgi:hypothetical protein